MENIEIQQQNREKRRKTGKKREKHRKTRESRGKQVKTQEKHRKTEENMGIQGETTNNILNILYIWDILSAFHYAKIS